MPRPIQSLRVFIASPRGLAAERRAFQEMLQKYNHIEGKQRGIIFEAVGWEETLSSVGQRPQETINEEVRGCDYFLLVLHNRWGSATGTGRYSSGSEEEYHEARKCLEAGTMKQIGVLFKTVDPAMMANPGPQLQKVLEFLMKLEGEQRGLYATFEDLAEFETLLWKYLAHWCRQHDSRLHIAHSDLPEPHPDLEVYGGENPLDRAEHLAEQGHLAEAEQVFSREAASGDWNACYQYGHFLLRLRRLSDAKEMFERVLELAGGEEGQMAIAYGSLGLIHRTRRELEHAEEMIKESLEIEKQLGRKAGMAVAYGNLGNVYKTRGELEKAEEMLNQALKINQQLGRKEGIATQYGNLGYLEESRTNPSAARSYYEKALDLWKTLGSPGEVAKFEERLAALDDD